MYPNDINYNHGYFMYMCKNKYEVHMYMYILYRDKQLYHHLITVGPVC